MVVAVGLGVGPVLVVAALGCQDLAGSNHTLSNAIRIVSSYAKLRTCPRLPSTDLLMIAQTSADERSVTIVSGRPEDLFGAAPR
jgi:hypothetical protein